MPDSAQVNVKTEPGTQEPMSVDRLVEALTDAREAIASLDVGALGWGSEPHELLGVNRYPFRDELLHNIDAALASVSPTPGKE